jgi:hypothetical protein
MNTLELPAYSNLVTTVGTLASFNNVLNCITAHYVRDNATKNDELWQASGTLPWPVLRHYSTTLGWYHGNHEITVRKSSLNKRFDHGSCEWLFVVYLQTLFQELRLYSVELKGGKCIVNWKWFGRKRSWPNTMYYPGIRLEGLRTTTKTSVRIAGLRTEIWTLDLPNTK